MILQVFELLKYVCKLVIYALYRKYVSYELAQVFKEMPCHYKLKQKIAELNSQLNTVPTPEGTSGVQQKLEERLRFCINNLVSY